MKKVLNLLVFLIICFLLAGFFFVARHMVSFVNFDYEESQKSLSNPARGFYEQVYVDSSDEAIPNIAREPSIKIVLLTMDLSDYCNKELDDKVTDALSKKLAQAKKDNLMVIFRASYKQNPSDSEPDISQIKSHIACLSKVLNDNKDVILAVQTGMIGLWGEWHSSKYLKDDGSITNEAREVIDCWLSNLDESIVLNLRRPSFIREAVSMGCDASHLGYHDDGLLGSDTDLGTYIDITRDEELAWAHDNLNGKVNGGEMPYVNSFSEFENATNEFDALSLTYLNFYYNKDVINSWSSEEFDYVLNHLGYRYSMESVYVPGTLRRDLSSLFSGNSSTFNIKVKLKNSGYSSIAARFKPCLVISYSNGWCDIFPLNIKQTKREENLSAKIKVYTDKDFSIGIKYTDSYHNVEFANDDTCFEDGVNYFISYDSKNKKWISVDEK